MRQNTGEDYPEAAIKHCDDAHLLLSGSQPRPDGSAYLAGYAIECILKTVIQFQRGTTISIREFAHDLTGLSNEAVRFAAQPSSKTARYFSQLKATALSYCDPPTGWKETLRYYPVGTVPLATARIWVNEAERLYIEIIGEMQKDGEI